MWRRGSNQTSFNDAVLGHALMGTVGFALMLHPKLWFAGTLAGAGFGMLYHTLYYSNLGPNRDKDNFSFQLSGLTDDQREEQRLRDEIQQLSLEKPIRSAEWRHI
jgi:hypothetical protein